jgi:predicted RNase H-like HicB family nuclease
MRFRATVHQAEGRYVAECLDLEACGEGASPEQALASLRRTVAERESPEGVALPEDTSAPSVDIVVVESGVREARPGPMGPGDPT